ncbi:hypothetical protein GXP67_19805 [Rhodocytophaga rosea]|uniref:Uncharacterized protein n=1 Tax=Rhodocytophaga rosea TaxID=2704465 RepID=A0A6C0GL69_9BACT|nr:Imm51 family immunity protein [Rhodocytophaga rosea]QHT68729.1 hypothetical protein GXP67_19805 [Rhodocytophaga rosea]
MKEIIEDTIYDDEFLPCEMITSEGFRKDVPTTFYCIELATDFDEEFIEIMEEFDLEPSGYLLESIILAFIEKENESLLDKIDYPLDCEASTFVVYMNSEEAQREMAKIIQKLCINKKLFRKTIKENIDSIKE